MHNAPAASCSSCHRAWHSETMLAGLALLGSCPRCGGDLQLHRSPDPTWGAEEEPRFDRRPPHLVLGRPRRSGAHDGRHIAPPRAHEAPRRS
jgi:hypothetical protein